jgi:hypothetical protein
VTETIVEERNSLRRETKYDILDTLVEEKVLELKRYLLKLLEVTREDLEVTNIEFNINVDIDSTYVTIWNESLEVIYESGF